MYRICGEGGCAGRVLYRACGEDGCAGRVMYRICGEGGCAGRVLYRICGEGGCAGRVLYRKCAVQLVLGEFCTQGARRGCCWANNVLLWRSARASCWAIAAPWHRSWAVRPSPPYPGVLRAGDGGFALHEALLRRVAGVSHPLVVQFPPSRGLPDERGTQNADHLGEKH